METKEQLANLYTQKGELLTEIEIMQAQLQRVNQLIVQIKNDMRKQDTEEKIDK